MEKALKKKSLFLHRMSLLGNFSISALIWVSKPLHFISFDSLQSTFPVSSLRQWLTGNNPSVDKLEFNSAPLGK